MLSFLIYRLDALLRQLYRIREFTDDPDRLLRLAMKRGGMPDFRLTTAKSGRTQRQSFGSKLIYGGASSNWLSTASTVAILGVAPGGFVSRAEPAMMTAKAASPARAFIVTPYADGWHREALTPATVAV